MLDYTVMIIDFAIDPKTYGEYCLTCHKKSILDSVVVTGEVPRVRCASCRQINERAIIIDPKIQWWLDKENRYWHKSIGMLVVNPEGKILVIERTKFPAGFSVPAGHVDNNEDDVDAAKRETLEEVGLSINMPLQVAHTPIHLDSCRRGCDDHAWVLFAVALPEGQHPVLEAREAKAFRWVTMDEFSQLSIPFAMQHLLKTYKKEIVAAVVALTA